MSIENEKVIWKPYFKMMMRLRPEWLDGKCSGFPFLQQKILIELEKIITSWIFKKSTINPMIKINFFNSYETNSFK